jgi:DNA repair exonuclease SbcCD ATPase subunit
LQERLAQRRKEARSLGKTIELLTRWVLERTRDADKPASTELRVALAAIEKAEPAAIPQIASTAVLLAEKNVQLADHENERAARAALVVDAGNQVATAVRELADVKQRMALGDRTLEVQHAQLDALRVQLEQAEEQLRIERGRIVDVMSERDALSQRLAEQLRANGGSWIKRTLKGMGL